MDKVRGKLSAWKMKTLSKAARLILIQAVTSTIPIYHMQTAKLSDGTIRAIDKLNRGFLWGDLMSDKKAHPIAWKTVCTDKKVGDLGIKNLKRMNLALLTKLGWRMAKERESLWAKILWAKYGDPLSKEHPKRSTSYIWRSLRLTANIIKQILTQESTENTTVLTKNKSEEVNLQQRKKIQHIKSI